MPCTIIFCPFSCTPTQVQADTLGTEVTCVVKHAFTYAASTSEPYAKTRTKKFIFFFKKKLLGRAGDIPAADPAFGFWLAANMPLRTDLKQDLLESRDCIARMRRLQGQLGLLVGTEAPADCRVQ